MGPFLNRCLKYGLGLFYLLAGLNHFINPAFYLPLIPDYLPAPILLNYLVGLIEITIGVLVFIPTYRKQACVGIISLLVLLIPSHLYFIQIGSCIENGLCIQEWIAWVRLLIVQPILGIWAWWVLKQE